MSKKKTEKKSHEKTDPRGRALVHVSKIALRLNAFATFLHRYKSTEEMLRTVQAIADSVGAINDAVDASPEDLGGRQRSGGAGAPNFAIGDKVAVREKQQKHYTDMMEEDDMTDLTVVAVAPRYVKVSAGDDGAVLFFPRRHLTAQKSE